MNVAFRDHPTGFYNNIMGFGELLSVLSFMLSYMWINPQTWGIEDRLKKIRDIQVLYY